MNRTQRRIIVAIVATLIVLAMSSLVGVIQAVALSGAPNYTTERAMHNVYLWGGIAASSMVVAILLIVRLRSGGK